MILLTYFLGMGTGCVQPTLQGHKISHANWNYKTACNELCNCDNVHQFEPVCGAAETFFSPCHAGCTAFDTQQHRWTDCFCANGTFVDQGFCSVECSNLPIYLAIMFVGLFLGNSFFMTTMVVVLRCVYDDQKSLALSFASFITNIVGFIPGPVIFGSVIDTGCAVWHSVCPTEVGNCILYDNQDFRHKYHLANAAFQFLAILAVVFTYVKSRKFTFPEEEVEEESQLSRDPSSRSLPVSY